MNKTTEYKKALNNHITFSYWDYLCPDEVSELRKENKGKAALPGCGFRGSYRIEGSKAICTSYYTDVFSYDFSTGEIEKLWEGYSKTTLKHVNAFCDLFHLGINFNKHNWIMF